MASLGSLSHFILHAHVPNGIPELADFTHFAPLYAEHKRRPFTAFGQHLIAYGFSPDWAICGGPSQSPQVSHEHAFSVPMLND